MDAASSDAPVNYPPDPHLLRDLALWLEDEAGCYSAGFEITPWLCNPGGVRAGVIATLVDVIGGAEATRAVRPNWVATCDLMLHLADCPATGAVIARSRLLRRGRSTAVIEVDLRGEESDGASVGLATLTFSVLESRTELQQRDPRTYPARTEFFSKGPGLEAPIFDRLGVRPAPGAPGDFELASASYNLNSLNATQGGALALLVEASAEAAVSQPGEASGVVRDLEIHYLALGRTGPFRAHPRILRRGSESTLVRVDLVDTGADDRPVVMATASLENPAAKRTA